MSLFLRLLIFLPITINFVLAIIVLVSNRKGRIQRLFFIFAFLSNFWLISNFLENEPNLIGMKNLGLALRFDFASAIILFNVWFEFCIAFVIRFCHTKKWIITRYVLTAITVLLSILSFTNAIIAEVNFSDGVIRFKDGPLLLVYALILVFCSFGGLIILFLRRRQAKREQDMILKRQINFIFFGFLLSWGTAIFVNLFLQTFFPISLEVARIGLYSMFFLTIFIAYAILRHGLLQTSVVATELFVLLLLVLLAIPLFQVENLYDHTADYLLGIIVFVSTIFFSILLLRSIFKEIKQRQQLAALNTSLEQVNKNLETANLRLKELDTQKTDFLSIASHQMRTPLSIFNGYIELLEEGAYGRVSKGIVEVLENMNENNQHLIKLVDEFLDITRIEQHRTKFTFTEMDLVKMITTVTKELSPKLRGKDLKLAWTPSAKQVLAQVDEEKIRHVIFNLIDNAIKYTEQGQVIVSLSEQDDGVVFTTHDTGVGFDKDDQVKFFQKFYRGANVRGVNVTGTGLGLFVANKFVDGHSGKIWAKSAGLGKGSEFGFWIPKNPPPVSVDNTGEQSVVVSYEPKNE
jgi:signal transduction histidine kinase